MGTSGVRKYKMALLNPDFENRLISLTKKICKPNCVKCRLSRVQGLEIRSKLFNLSKKRRNLHKGDEKKYFEALEFNLESVKHRKLSDSHSKFYTSRDSEPNRSQPDQDPKNDRKRARDTSVEEYEKVLENVKKRLVNLKDDLHFNLLKVSDKELENEPSDYHPIDYSKLVDISTLRDLKSSHKVDFEGKNQDVSTQLPKVNFNFVKDATLLESHKTLDVKKSVTFDATTEKGEKESAKELQDKVTTVSESKAENLSDKVEDKDGEKFPFDILHKINVPIPKGNPLFAPKESDFKPKTDGANFVFGQSTQSIQKTGEPVKVFSTPQTQQMPQTQIFNPQFVIPGFGQNVDLQANVSNPFTTGQFFKSKRGRGRGRGR